MDLVASPECSMSSDNNATFLGWMGVPEAMDEEPEVLVADPEPMDSEDKPEPMQQDPNQDGKVVQMDLDEELNPDEALLALYPESLPQEAVRPSFASTIFQISRIIL